MDALGSRPPRKYEGFGVACGAKTATLGSHKVCPGVPIDREIDKNTMLTRSVLDDERRYLCELEGIVRRRATILWRRIRIIVQERR